MPTPYQKAYTEYKDRIESDALMKRLHQRGQEQRRAELGKQPLFINGKRVGAAHADIFQEAVDYVNDLMVGSEEEYNKAFREKVNELSAGLPPGPSFEYPVIKLKDGKGSLDEYRGKEGVSEKTITDAFREGLVTAQREYPDNPEKHEQASLDFVRKNYPELPKLDSIPSRVKEQLDTSDPKGFFANLKEAYLGSKGRELSKQGRISDALNVSDLKRLGDEAHKVTKDTEGQVAKVAKTKGDIASLKKSLSDSEKQYEEFKKSQAGYTPYVSQQPYTGEFKAYSQSPESLHPWEGKGFKNYIAPMPTYGLTPGPSIGQESQAMMGGKSIKNMSADELLAYNKYVRERDARVQSSRTPQKPSVQMPEIDQNLTPSERRKQLGGYKGSMIEGMPSEEYWKFHPRN
jgi:hypothetical protein